MFDKEGISEISGHVNGGPSSTNYLLKLNLWNYTYNTIILVLVNIINGMDTISGKTINWKALVFK